MKMLTKNELIGSTLSALNASANYPARHLIDPFLRLRYQATTTSDTIVITPTSPIGVDSFFLGYVGHLNSVSVEFFVGGAVQQLILIDHVTGAGERRAFGDGTLKSFGAGPVDFFSDYSGQQFASRHFGLIENVDEIRITLAGSGDIYIGGVAAGVAIDMPAAVAGWPDEFIDDSSIVRSPHGQVQQLYIEPYKRFTFQFDAVKFEKYYEIKNALMALGRGGGAWVTFFEDSEDEFPPMYCTVDVIAAERERFFYNFGLEFTEAR